MFSSPCFSSLRCKMGISTPVSPGWQLPSNLSPMLKTGTLAASEPWSNDWRCWGKPHMQTGPNPSRSQETPKRCPLPRHPCAKGLQHMLSSCCMLGLCIALHSSSFKLMLSQKDEVVCPSLTASSLDYSRAIPVGPMLL